MLPNLRSKDPFSELYLMENSHSAEKGAFSSQNFFQAQISFEKEWVPFDGIKFLRKKIAQKNQNKRRSFPQSLRELINFIGSKTNKEVTPRFAKRFSFRKDLKKLEIVKKATNFVCKNF